MFGEIPRAKALLCAVNNKLAASYGRIGHQELCRDHAEEAIAIAAGARVLEVEEACAHMNLGSALRMLGERDRGRREYSRAREMLSRIHGTETNSRC